MSINPQSKAVSHWPLLRYFAHLLAVCVRKIAGAFARAGFGGRTLAFHTLLFGIGIVCSILLIFLYLFLPDRRFTGLSSLNNARRVIISGHYRQNFCFLLHLHPVSVGRVS